MLSKRERRSLVINTLSIPKYLRFYLADQSDNDHKRAFHHHVETMVSNTLSPEDNDYAYLKKLIKRSAGFWPHRVYLFFRHIFTRN